jgi:hypothetical protein
VTGRGDFAAAVGHEFAFLVTKLGFAVTRETDHIVELETPTLRVQAVWDPRGEVAVNVSRRGDDRYAEWSYTGMVGRASIERLLEIARARIQAEPAILAGDRDFYDDLATTRRHSAQEWTAYYAGTGPRPKNR